MLALAAHLLGEALHRVGGCCGGDLGSRRCRDELAISEEDLLSRVGADAHGLRPGPRIGGSLGVVLGDDQAPLGIDQHVDRQCLPLVRWAADPL